MTLKEEVLNKFREAVISGVIGIFVFCSLVAYVWLARSGLLHGYKNYFFQRKLRHASQTDATSLKISELTNFEWDTVCFYWPYSYDANGGSDGEYVPEDDGIYHIAFKSGKTTMLLTTVHRSMLAEDDIQLTTKAQSGKVCGGRGMALKIKNGEIFAINNQQSQ